FQRHNGDIILRFTQQFGKFVTRHLVGQYLRSDYTRSVTVGADNLLLPGMFNPGSRVGEVSCDSGSGITEYRSVADYGEFTGGYNNYLFLTLTGRNDWVSVLSENNRSYFYPGVSTSFIFNEAIPALKDSRKLTFGK